MAPGCLTPRPAERQASNGVWLGLWLHQISRLTIYGVFDKVAPLVGVLLVFASFAFQPALIVTFPLTVSLIVRLAVKVRRHRRRHVQGSASE